MHFLQCSGGFFLSFYLTVVMKPHLLVRSPAETDSVHCKDGRFSWCKWQNTIAANGHKLVYTVQGSVVLDCTQGLTTLKLIHS